MSASRLHFFLPVTFRRRRKEETRGVTSPELALWKVVDAPAGEVPDPRSYQTSVHPDVTSSANTTASPYQHIFSICICMHPGSRVEDLTCLLKGANTVTSHSSQITRALTNRQLTVMSHCTKINLNHNQKKSFPGPRSSNLIIKLPPLRSTQCTRFPCQLKSQRQILIPTRLRPKRRDFGGRAGRGRSACIGCGRAQLRHSGSAEPNGRGERLVGRFDSIPRWEK